MSPTPSNIQSTLEQAKILLSQETNCSPALKAVILLLMNFLEMLSASQAKNSRNSSKPPSSDPHREKRPKNKSLRKPGGQPGHQGKTLEPFEQPDETLQLKVDRRHYRQHGKGQRVGTEQRQIVDIQITRFVTQYDAEIVVFEDGTRIVADFPDGVDRPVQYGNSVKAAAVYLSQFQLLPYARLADYFDQQLDIPISTGSLTNFNAKAFELLDTFENIAIRKLKDAQVMNADETGVNINGKGHWLHVSATTLWTHYAIHKRRGKEAFDEIGILADFDGILCHDHWKPYYACCPTSLHSLCNSHHLRELTFAYEQDEQAWAGKIHQFLLKLNEVVDDAGGVLDNEQQKKQIRRYRYILKQAEVECPPPDESKRPPGKRGRLKRSKSRNLLERLIDFEDDVLRFMTNPDVPFTNNLAENDLRMTKVQQKISGCFRSLQGAQIFCRIRGYLTTCRKQGVNPTDALNLLFDGNLPDFCDR
jgi:transposase